MYTCATRTLLTLKARFERSETLEGTALSLRSSEALQVQLVGGLFFLLRFDSVKLVARSHEQILQRAARGHLLVTSLCSCQRCSQHRSRRAGDLVVLSRHGLVLLTKLRCDVLLAQVGRSRKQRAQCGDAVL